MVGGLQALIFDLDDTLYSEKDYIRSGFAAIANQIVKIEYLEEKLWSAFNNGEIPIDYVLNSEGIYNDELKEKCLDIYRKYDPDIKIYDGY